MVKKTVKTEARIVNTKYRIRAKWGRPILKRNKIRVINKKIRWSNLMDWKDNWQHREYNSEWRLNLLAKRRRRRLEDSIEVTKKLLTSTEKIIDQLLERSAKLSRELERIPIDTKFPKEESKH